MTTISSQQTETDPRPSFSAALDVASGVVAAVTPDQLDGSTPCADYDVRELLGHLAGAVENFVAVGRGAPAPEDGGRPPVPDGEWTTRWADLAEDARTTWESDEMLNRTFDFGWAQMTGAEALAVYTSEVVLHTWDLARATNQRPAWNDGVLVTALAALQAALPAEGRAERFEEARQHAPAEWGEFKDPFAAAVEVPADAGLLDQLVAWSGRRP